MFRVPKPTAEECDNFYQSEYEQGFTTDCPAPDELRRLKETSFAGTEKDYLDRLSIDVLRVGRSGPREAQSSILAVPGDMGVGNLLVQDDKV